MLPSWVGAHVTKSRDKKRQNLYQISIIFMPNRSCLLPHSGACLQAKMYCIYGKKISMHLSRYKKNIACKQIFQNFPTLCAIMHFFRNYANYALRAELCDFASAHKSRSPDYYRNCSFPAEICVLMSYGQELALLSLLLNYLRYLLVKRGQKSSVSKETKTIKRKKKTAKNSKFYQNGNFDFLTASHKIKFGELQPTSILVI